MEFIIILFVLGSFAVAIKNIVTKKVESGNKNVPENNVVDVFKNTPVPSIEKKPAEAAYKPIQPAAPRIREHLHGTTNQTSFSSCNKPHDGTYKSNFKVTSLSEEKKMELSQEEIKKILIVGDAISTPAFKRKRR